MSLPERQSGIISLPNRKLTRMIDPLHQDTPDSPVEARTRMSRLPLGKPVRDSPPPSSSDAYPRKDAMATGAPPKRSVQRTTVRSGTVRIAAIGASAGGLDAFRELVSAIPPDTGLAFVLIQHLDPRH